MFKKLIAAAVTLMMSVQSFGAAYAAEPTECSHEWTETTEKFTTKLNIPPKQLGGDSVNG